MLPKKFLSTLALLALVAPTVSEYEIPTEIAMPPKMDPIPTLPKVTQRVFFDIEVGGKKAGRIVLGLFGEIAPKAVENFVGLCECNKGKGKLTGKDLCYRGSKIHRIIPNFAFQGGDITHGDGTGGESIYGAPFEDESFEVKFTRRFLLSMATTRNGNGSQFFINTVKTQWLTGKYEIFGMVLDGLKTIIEIEMSGTFGGHPSREVKIVDSGTLPLETADHSPYRVSWQLES
eukprot:CAMPEP_0113656648 /NCGR_PEP_ID=MMETSP0017_2-20120614/30504_1 /TAXON_ID=2856 /ORGANISM="Cylindrotheca closterium" /LENGTH=231 /DNA_ID=CAMNT_0000570281 /DNA_START=73 /DNA_END=768 /DNA_ORIENTATION=+ /assembly_acc=CAM_ASM_000147